MSKIGDMAQLSKTQLFDFIQGKPWAISRSMLESIQRVLSKCEDNFVDLATAKAAFNLDSPKKKQRAYRVEDGSAVIPVHGVLDKRASFILWLFGGTSMEELTETIRQALEDEEVQSIVLNIDSPGGSVDGTKDLADFIFESRGKKPITAYVDGYALSAAYWIASAADKIIAPETAKAGSIGVWTSHLDASKLYEAAGLKKTYIYAGEYKVAGHEAAPLSEKDKEYLQSFVDKYYSIFVNDVARNRGVSVKKVLNDMAEGRVFIGTDALAAGLVDKIGGFKSALKRRTRRSTRAEDVNTEVKLGANTLDSESSKEAPKEEGASSTSHIPNTTTTDDITTHVTKEDSIMNLKELKEQCPELVEALQSEAVTSFKVTDEFTGLVKERDELKTDNEALKASNEELHTKNQGFEKEATLAEEKLAASVADKEMDNILASSSIPEGMHAKVKKQVDFHGYVKDEEKFTEGSDAFKKFSAEFKAEVEDWEKNMSGSTPSVGLGESKANGADPAGDLIEYGKKVARSVGAIRSDEKE